MTKIEELTPAEAALTPRELAAYQWLLKRPGPAISPDTQAKWFSLFLQGKSCEKIAELNRGFTLAQVVKCRIDGNWDQRLNEHLNQLLDRVRVQVQQTTLEGVNFIRDQLAVAHKMFGDDLSRYLQSGNKDDLPEFSIKNFKQYKEAVELLKTLTGQDTKKISGEVLHRHSVEEPVPSASRGMSPEEARTSIRTALQRQKKDE